MKFPINVSKQKTCPVCKKPGPGTRLPGTPRPEVVSLSFVAMPVGGWSVDSYLTVGWDAGVAKHPQSLYSLGAAFHALKFIGKYNGSSQLHVEFCSTRCLRQFLMAAVDELEVQIKKVMPEVKRAKKK
jgi:hypothetical protein